MRRKQKSERELEKQVGGFVRPGVVVGKSRRARPIVKRKPEPEPEPQAEPDSNAKGGKG